MAQRTISKLTGLAFVLGIYFLLLGIQGLVGYNSTGGQIIQGLNNLLGSNSNVITLLISILLIVSGVVLILGPLGVLSGGLLNLAYWIILGFWIAYLVWTLVIHQDFRNGVDFDWLVRASHGAVILVAIMHSRRFS